MRWILLVALVMPCALVGCHMFGGVETETAEYETVSLVVSGMT